MDAAARKARPLFRGLLAYFPRALMEVAHCSYIGNEQHSPGQPLRWDKSKSTDELDALLRHLADRAMGEVYDTDNVRLLAKVAWRACAALERELEAEDAATPAAGPVPAGPDAQPHRPHADGAALGGAGTAGDPRDGQHAAEAG
jgi:hypothetical protein